MSEPIMVREVEFPSIEACSAHFGVCVQHIKMMQRKGLLDRIGQGRHRGARPKTTRMPVEVRGQWFASVDDCAAHFQISTSCVYTHVSKGTPDSIGLGKGLHNRGRATGRGKTLTLGPFTFRTMEQASLFLGFSKGYVSGALRGGARTSIQRVHERALAKAAEIDAAARKQRAGRM